MAKNFQAGIKFAKQPRKGPPRAGDGSDEGPLPKRATKSPYDNPAVGKDTGKGTPPVIGKLGG